MQTTLTNPTNHESLAEEESRLAARLWLGADAAAAEIAVRADKLTAEDSVIVTRVQLMGQTA